MSKLGSVDRGKWENSAEHHTREDNVFRENMPPWLANNLNLLLSVAGLLISAVGVGIAFRQARKASQAAKAAQAASLRTERQIGRQVLLADVAIALKTLEEVRSLLRAGRFEASLIRVTDLLGQLTQLEKVQGPLDVPDFRQDLPQLSILQDLLERKVQDAALPVDTARAGRTLSKVAVELNRWMGAHKYAVAGGSANGNR